ncbi:glutathione S-transferase family protein [Sorangium atrum]|uniref:Glutathione S-transferase family protein n=1 Tax=Sorangium atrum TaxID=2995308 RepID=A0ABT5C6S4_9BACT|nr:glutathione S-transferase family protein [Sorangium aterium]MDC0682121.1 glutathione S-transferase family protein [Sorangium aterium]
MEAHDAPTARPITLYGFGKVPSVVIGLTRDLRILWALEELGLPYEVHGLDQPKGELNEGHFARISPFNQVPVIEDDGFVIAESGAILLHLAERAGELSDLRKRAEVTRWTFAALTTVEPPIAQIVLLDLKAKFGKTAGADLRPELCAWAQRCLGALDRWLDGKQFVTGDDFTVADIAMTTVLRQAWRADLLGDHPHVRRYRELCEARPAWARALAGYEQRLGVAAGAARTMSA